MKKNIKCPKKATIIDELEDGAVFLPDEFDDAILGTCERFGSPYTVVAYDTEKILQEYVRQGMTYDEALEFFNFNTLGAYVGEQTPVFIRTVPNV